MIANNDHRPDLRTLQVGTRVVFKKDGAYMTGSWLFGVLTRKPRSKALAVQLVEVEDVVLDCDPVTSHTKVTPLWDRPLRDCVYTIVTGRGIRTGLQWLRGHASSVLTQTMTLVPVFDGIYDEGRQYIDCRESP